MNPPVPVVGLITARGGSKGIPGKNLRLVGGRPLIAWTIGAAQASRKLTRTIVSTDDPEIAGVASAHGAEVPFVRPEGLAQDASSHISVVLHALEWLEANGGAPEYLCLLQPTSPLRKAEDIDAAIALALARRADAVIGVTPMVEHPYLARKIEPDGSLSAFIKSDLKYERRQDFPPAYRINGAIYVNRVASLRREHTFTPAGTLAYVMPEERSVDVDSPADLVLVEHFLKTRHATG